MRERKKRRSPSRAEEERAGAVGADATRASPRLGRAPAVAVHVVATLAILASVTYCVNETDFWQHLLVGRVIWQTHAVPARQLWTWPTYGAPDVNTSWGFRAIIWPIWSIGGWVGLFLWRWLTTLGVFGLLWATARRMGARGLTPAVVMVLCSLIYRERVQIRPETLVGILIALELWILESRRHPTADVGASRRLDPIFWIIPIAAVWINSHISYFLCFLLLGIHALADWLTAHAAHRPARQHGQGAAPPARPRRGSTNLLLIALAALAIAFVNPFGWRALWQPFDFFIFKRHQLIYRIILELRPVDWTLNTRNLLPLLMAGWPVLAIWRARRHGLDSVEVMTCAVFSALPLTSARFVGFYALVAAPYVARDFDAWVRARRWPSWTAQPWPRAALAMAFSVAIGIPEWSRADLPLGIGIDLSQYPVAACDFMADHGIRGRGFNKFEFGGYQAYRFWPDRSRLPFMDIHQAGTPADQELYARSLVFPAAWRELDAKYHFDYALVSQGLGALGSRIQVDRIVDFLDADSSWALVLLDDPSRLYVRRGGALDGVARAYGCRVLCGGAAKLVEVFGAASMDTTLRAGLKAELAKQAALSPHHSSTRSLIAYLDLLDGHPQESRRSMREALRVDPHLPRGHEWLGRLDLAENRLVEALDEFERERAQHHSGTEVDYWTGVAYQRLGDRSRARKYYLREVARNPGNGAAIESLATIERSPHY